MKERVVKVSVGFVPSVNISRIPSLLRHVVGLPTNADQFYRMYRRIELSNGYVRTRKMKTWFSESQKHKLIKMKELLKGPKR